MTERSRRFLGTGLVRRGCLPLGGTGCAMGSARRLDLSGGLGRSRKRRQVRRPGDLHGGHLGRSTQGTDCTGGQVCCANIGGAGDAGLAALEEGGLAALGSTPQPCRSTQAPGASARSPALNFTTSCAAACTGSQIEACASATECVGGGTCESITSLIGDAGAGVDAGR